MTKHTTRSLTAALVLAHLAQPSGVARAQDRSAVAACVKASDEGQQQRDEGKLLDAKERFIECSQESCPSVVRKECAQWLTQLNARIPKIVPVLKDETGADVLKATLLVDGKEVATELDGKAIALDPGQHTFRFEVAGKAPVEVKAVIRDGEQRRTVEASLAPDRPAPTTPPPAVELDQGSPVLGYVLAGVGVVGLGSFGYFAYSGTSKKSDLEKTCAPNCLQSDVDSVKQKLLIADVSLAVGIVALGVGAYLILTHGSGKSAPKAAASQLLVGPTGAGFAF